MVGRTETAVKAAPGQRLTASNPGRGRTVAFGTSRAPTEVLRDLTLTNTKKVAAAGMTVALPEDFAWVGGSYPGEGGTCADSLAPGASCTLKLRFAPRAPGTFVQTMQVRYTLKGAPAGLDVPLKGTRRAPPPPKVPKVPLATDSVVVEPQCFGVTCSASMVLVRLTKPLELAASTCDDAWKELDAACAQYGARAPVTTSEHLEGWGCDRWFSTSNSGQLETSDAWNPTGAWMYGSMGAPFPGGRVWIVSGEPSWLSKATYPALQPGENLMSYPEKIAWESYHPMTGGSWETLTGGTAAAGDWLMCATAERRPAQPLHAANPGKGVRVLLGSTTPGGTIKRTIALRNDKRAAAEGLSIELPAALSRERGAKEDCDARLDAGGACTVTLTWSPKDPGELADTIRVRYKFRDASAGVDLEVRGTATSPEKAPDPDPSEAEKEQKAKEEQAKAEEEQRAKEEQAKAEEEQRAKEEELRKQKEAEQQAELEKREREAAEPLVEVAPPPAPGPLPKNAVYLKPACNDGACDPMVLVRATDRIDVGAADCDGAWKNLAGICAAYGATAPTTSQNDWLESYSQCKAWFSKGNPSAPVTSDQWNPTGPWMKGELASDFPGGRVWMAAGDPGWLSRAVYPKAPTGQSLLSDEWAIEWESYHPMTGGNWKQITSGTIEPGDWVLCAAKPSSPEGAWRQNALRGRGDGGPSLGRWLRGLLGRARDLIVRR